MTKRRRYDDDFRANAVLMLEAAGYPEQRGALTAVSKKLKVPLRTISRWFLKEQNPPPDQLVREKRGELIERLNDLAHALMDAIYDDLKANGVDAVRAMTAVGIAIDKLQLLEGKPTWRGEVVNMLKEGIVTPQQVKGELGDDLAVELFNEAGIDVG